MRSFIQLYRERFTKQPERVKYLYINKKYYRTIGEFGLDGIFETHEFESKEKAAKWLDEDVAKSEQADWQLYVEVDA